MSAPSIPAGIPPQPAAPEHITLIPIVPAQIKRYDRKILIPRDYRTVEIKKGLLSYLEELPSVWQPLTHPEGALFFYHPDQRVFTNADVRNPEIATKVYRAAEKAYREAREANVTLHPSVELGLELMGDGRTAGYYFADCSCRVVFWFENNESHYLMNSVQGVEHISHIGYAIESQYWKHIELFPNKRFLPKVEVVRLKGLVMHALGDNITSGTSLAPFSPAAIVNMLALVDPLMSDINEEHEHSVFTVARFMVLFCNSKFINFCGQPGARLQPDQSLYGDLYARPKHKIYRFMNIVLFGSPDAHGEALHRIWVDKTILHSRWINFIDRLNGEWNGYAIFSNVILVVDIGFLAIPSVQDDRVAILVSYLSILCATGSLVVSLVLAGQVNNTRRSNAEGAVSFTIDCRTFLYARQVLFMEHMSKSLLGLESLATILSAPFALLIWGMLFFGAALSTLIFRTSDTITISITAVMLSAEAILATWPVLTASNIHLSSLRAHLSAGLMHNESQSPPDPVTYYREGSTYVGAREHQLEMSTRLYYIPPSPPPIPSVTTSVGSTERSVPVSCSPSPFPPLISASALITSL